MVLLYKIVQGSAVILANLEIRGTISGGGNSPLRRAIGIPWAPWSSPSLSVVPPLWYWPTYHSGVMRLWLSGWQEALLIRADLVLSRRFGLEQFCRAEHAVKTAAFTAFFRYRLVSAQLCYIHARLLRHQCRSSAVQ